MGLWQESITSNTAAAAAAEREIKAHQAEAHYEFHPMDYLQYAYLQIGRDKDAWHVIEQVDSVPDASADTRAQIKSFFTARYYLELHDWSHAATLTVPSEMKKHDAIDTYWAQMIGAARTGDAAAANKAYENYKSVDDGEGMYGMSPKNHQVSVERQEVNAWADYAAGKKDDAVRELRAAADQEDADAPEIAMMPAREMLADMLLEMNRVTDALVEYEKNLKESPNRFDGLYGAAHAAELAGKPDQAAGYYTQLLKICDGSQSDRPELAHARTLLATK
jgi:tetratricopeptide (TPR) repeat protein